MTSFQRLYEFVVVVLSAIHLTTLPLVRILVGIGRHDRASCKVRDAFKGEAPERKIGPLPITLVYSHVPGNLRSPPSGLCSLRPRNESMPTRAPDRWRMARREGLLYGSCIPGSAMTVAGCIHCCGSTIELGERGNGSSAAFSHYSSDKSELGEGVPQRFAIVEKRASRVCINKPP